MRRALLLLVLVLPSLLWAKPRVTQTKFTSRKVPVHVVSCSLSNGFSAVALIQPAPSGVPGASSVCADPLESARKAGLVAAVNATAFMYPLDAPPEERNTRWYAGKPVRLFGLNVQDGVRRNPDHPNRQVMWFDAFWAKAVREAEKIPLARPQVCLDRDGVQRPSLRVGRQAVLDRERVVRLRRPRAGGAGEKEFALCGGMSSGRRRGWRPHRRGAGWMFP